MTLFAALLAAIAAVVAPVAGELVKGEEPPILEGTCLQLQLDYADAIGTSAELSERILPGVDGRSTLLADPQATACGLTPADFATSDGVAEAPGPP